MANLLPAPIDAEVIDDPLDELRDQLQDVRDELSELRAQLAQVLAWMNGLRTAVNGGQVAAAPETPSVPQPPNEAAWRAWKERLPAPCGRIIDALLIQPLSQTQIATQARVHTSNVSRNLSILRGNQLIDRDGTKWKLKRL